ALHLPLKQRPEQHSFMPMQSLPSVLQFGLRAAHMPPLHVPLQHAPSFEHASPCDVHCARLQTPPRQTPEQQSAPVLHAEPTPPRFRQLTPPPVPPPAVPMLPPPLDVLPPLLVPWPPWPLVPVEIPAP